MAEVNPIRVGAYLRRERDGARVVITATYPEWVLVARTTLGGGQGPEWPVRRETLFAIYRLEGK